MRNWWNQIRGLLVPPETETPDAPKVEDPDVQERLIGFQRDLGVTFRNPDLLEQALTHRSFLGCTGGDPHYSNERMEFLGDAVLELIVIDHLYGVYDGDREGALTKKKGLLVSRKVLANSAEWMKLGQYVLLSPAERDAGGPTRTSILADTLEAVIAAIYLDQGLEAARKFVHQRLLAHTDSIIGDLSKANFKSQLQEYVQAKFKTHPRYRVVTEVGPDHRKLFTVEVSIRGRLLGRGQGYNKKEAQQNAAKNATLELSEKGELELNGALGGALPADAAEPTNGSPESAGVIPDQSLPAPTVRVEPTLPTPIAPAKISPSSEIGPTPSAP